MDLTSLIGPAVVAAVIASIVSVIGFLINRATVRGMHTERLAFDEKQADRRGAAEIALAEKKLALDRAFAAWKRRSELTEVVLADFYQARRIIQEARLPGIRGDEGKSRPRSDRDKEENARLDEYFAPAERLYKKSEFFSQLHARRYSFMTFFGSESGKPFDDLHKVHSDIIVAVQMLLMTDRERSEGFNPQGIRQWQATIGWNPEADTISSRLDTIVDVIEQTCRPVIQEPVQ
jgi:hypothetical protein